MTEYWPHLLAAALTVAASAATAVHILIRKEDTRAAVGWLGLVWFSPLLGLALYWVFGVNRIRRRARTLRSTRVPVELPERTAALAPAGLAAAVPGLPAHLVRLAGLTERVARQPLMGGNRIVALRDGDEAYPAMLGAIAEARRSVALATYLFDNDRWGGRFREALGAAAARGVAVRVLIDAVGARYSVPPVTHELRRAGVPVAVFLPSTRPWRLRYFNLRTHRKILVVDGRRGFTGGMNIRAGHVLADAPRHPVRDTHFLVEGPVAAELQRAFAEDWRFTTGERLVGEGWFPRLGSAGVAVARGISDGPDEDFDKLRLTLLGAVACARESILVATPYFLPDRELAAALQVASLRGVAVEILLPERGNLPYVQWAATAGLGRFIAAGCRVFLGPPPFDHSKLMVVDGGWSLIGSANWDPRSLLLNFEFNLECYDPGLAAELAGIFAAKRAEARELTEAALAARPAVVVLRDRLFRLFSPYL